MHRTSIRKLVVYTIVGMIFLFIVVGTLTSFAPGKGLASSTIHDFANKMKGENFIYVIGMENQYFKQSLPHSANMPSVSSVVFELMTNVSFDDPRSLLGREIPGFSLFTGRMVVAGEGSDYSTMPIESPPPLEVLLAEREAAAKNIEGMDKPPEAKREPKKTTKGKKVVHLVHTHNRESFLPELEGVENPNHAWHSEVNITLVGERIAQTLENYGIGSVADKTDIQAILQQRNWDYVKSYDVSREIIQKAMQENQDLQFFFDIHRDSQPRNVTTVTINGVDYAKTIFVIGRDNPHYEQNLQFAKQLHHLLNEYYPGLSRGIFEVRGSPGTNGNFNQDLSTKSLLLEVGGVENTLEENFRTAEAFAEVFSKYFWEHWGE